VRAPDTQLSLFTEQTSRPTSRPEQLPGIDIRESARARRLSIKVYPRGRVEVVVPKRTRPADVQAFVDENRGWISEAVESFACQQPPEAYALPSRIRLPGIGREFLVSYRRGSAAGIRYRQVGSTLVLSGRTSDREGCVQAIRRWLAGVARQELEPVLQRLSAQTEMPFARVQIRAQRTCWGSRSSTGTISLNLCLLFLDPRVLRYLMIHELCHYRHMNHSRRFWQLVGRYEPDYRQLDRALGESWQQVPAWLGIY